MMDPRIFVTRSRRHVAVWVATKPGFGNFRAICGSEVEPGRGRTTLLMPWDEDQRLEIPVCPGCASSSSYVAAIVARVHPS